METINSLLYQVGAILKGYAVLKQNSQDHFNIFKILQMQSDEVRLHSTLLAELLNPRGSHCKGEAFLEKFIATVTPSQCKEFNCRHTRVTAEKFIGPISPDQTQGGRIDIYMEDNVGQVILIENKIYAGDQPKQLLRYHNHINEKPGTILYLTLKGDDASGDSKGHLVEGKHYSRISYKRDILRWLDECHQVSSDAPVLRETIKQYSDLVKHYTGQTTDKKLHMDIRETLLLSPQNLTSAYYIASNFKHAKHALLKEFWSEVAEKLRKELGEAYDVYFKENMDKNYPALFVNERSYFTQWQVQFVLEPLNGKSSWMRNCLYYGIWCNHQKAEVQQVHTKLLKLFNQKTKNPKWWLQLNRIGDLDFGNISTLKLVLPGTQEREELQEQIIKTFQAYILENAALMKKLVEILKPVENVAQASTGATY
ncbi:PD-(D/E)XK nuclease superfamily protein [Pontibacter ummariensis]|uniref:PD-(D/E)XK nuclease superfamily protein n=1 Tax=Pontibacter ummariensis TaxID=1610492 RepID=A0A239IF21_9BACT|nr:PD-(D/E)XK nuclease family protein [Pontibacter ummariensis]PRY09817.1 PD-(D/E)XK nuclease superfamily protein [Pontibacter ummariensis]SNS92129.1 PD-(D/E)XK nuclease superfamily protein [Pontibacter ummariensis]